MAPTSRTSPTAGETTDDAAGRTGSETPPPSDDTSNADLSTSDANTGDTDLKAQPKGPRIVFKGSESTIRRLTTKDWTDKGVDAPAAKVDWSKQPGGNDHEVDVSDWSEDQIAVALAADERFSHKTD